MTLYTGCRGEGGEQGGGEQEESKGEGSKKRALPLSTAMRHTRTHNGEGRKKSAVGRGEGRKKKKRQKRGYSFTPCYILYYILYYTCTTYFTRRKRGERGRRSDATPCSPPQCQKRPSTVCKETYYSVKRDLISDATPCSPPHLSPPHFCRRF